MSEGFDHPIGFNWKLVGGLFVCWLLAFLSLYKGIQSLGKVSYFTALFPYVMIFALIIRGVTLPGSMKGIIYYIGSLDTSKLFTLKVFEFKNTLFRFHSYHNATFSFFQTWIDAASQVYFCLSNLIFIV
jgi:SNF family Na+-dependent transporter